MGVKEGIGESAILSTVTRLASLSRNGIGHERQSKGARGDEGEGFEHHHSFSRGGNPPNKYE
jgi:hypothetical protein